MRLCLCCLSQHSNSSAGQDVPGSVRPSGTAFRFYFRRRPRLPGVDRTRSRRHRRHPRCSRARFRSAPGRLPVGRRDSVSVCFRIRTKRMWLVYTGSWRSVRLIWNREYKVVWVCYRDTKKSDIPAGIRTRDLWIRSPTRYPLRYGDCFVLQASTGRYLNVLLLYYMDLRCLPIKSGNKSN